MSLHRALVILAWAVTFAAFLVVLSCRAPEETSESPRPANAPCDRCGPRPTLTTTIREHR